MEAAQSQFDAVVKERAEKEATKAAEVKRLAEEELDGFYDERTDEVIMLMRVHGWGRKEIACCRPLFCRL